MADPKPIFDGRRLRVFDAEFSKRSPFSNNHLWIAKGAFGSGEHETTAMCLQLLEECLLEGKTALDLGTGTGILAIAAIKLGCERVVAVDPSSQAMETCRQNARLNGVEERIEFVEGELKDLSPDSRFNLIMANLYGHLLDKLIPQLCGMLEPGGAMVLSGMLYGEDFSIIRQAEKLGVITERRLGGEEYLAFGMRKVV